MSNKKSLKQTQKNSEKMRGEILIIKDESIEKEDQKTQVLQIEETVAKKQKSNSGTQVVKQFRQVETTTQTLPYKPSFKTASQYKTEKVDIVTPEKFLNFMYRISQAFPIVWIPCPPTEDPLEPNISDMPEVNFIIDKPQKPKFFIQFVFSIHPSTKFYFKIGLDEDNLFFTPYEEYQQLAILNGFVHYSEDSYALLFDSLNEWCALNKVTMAGMNLFCQQPTYFTQSPFKHGGLQVVYDKSFRPALPQFANSVDPDRELRYKVVKEVQELLHGAEIIETDPDNDTFNLRNSHDLLKLRNSQQLQSNLETFAQATYL